MDTPDQKRPTAWRRLSNASVVLPFCALIILGWRTDDKIWLASQAGIVIVQLFEIVWPARKPKAVKVTEWAFLVVLLFALPVGLWRQFERPAPVQKAPSTHSGYKAPQ